MYARTHGWTNHFYWTGHCCFFLPTHTHTHTHIKWTLYFNYFIMFVIMNIKLSVPEYLLLSHSICLHACKICVVFVETKPESNSHKLQKVLSHPQRKTSYIFLCWLVNTRNRSLRIANYQVTSLLALFTTPTSRNKHNHMYANNKTTGIPQSVSINCKNVQRTKGRHSRYFKRGHIN